MVLVHSYVVGGCASVINWKLQQPSNSFVVDVGQPNEDRLEMLPVSRTFSLSVISVVPSALRKGNDLKMLQPADCIVSCQTGLTQDANLHIVMGQFTGDALSVSQVSPLQRSPLGWACSMYSKKLGSSQGILFAWYSSYHCGAHSMLARGGDRQFLEHFSSLFPRLWQRTVVLKKTAC